MSKPLRLDAVLRAGELAKRGLGTSKIARALDPPVSPSTVKRWKAARPDLFQQHEPGSLEHRRAILLDVLERGDSTMSEKLKAVDLLDRLDDGRWGAGDAPVTIYVASLDTCPHCGAKLDPVARDGNDPANVVSNGNDA